MCLKCWEGINSLGKWDTKYVNGLPDEAFAVIEPDYQRGKSKNKNARHLPHHAQGVKNGRDSKDNIDMPHLRNALARVDQITPVTQSISKDELVKRAKSHLESHAKDLGIGGRDKEKESKHSLPTGTDDAPKKSVAAFSESLSALNIGLMPNGQLKTRFESSAISIDMNSLEENKLMSRLQETRDGNISVVDIKPKPEDFIKANVRALSKIIIPNRYIDFTEGNVLKNSTKMLNNLTLYRDHNVRVEEWVGVVTDPTWDGESEPNGVNATIKVDAVANPRIARGMLSEPPAISRVSVTVWFDWVKSHDLDDLEFCRLLGSKLDDEIVRFIAKRITGYGELSLVWYGADPNAKQRGKVKVGSEN